MNVSSLYASMRLDSSIVGEHCVPGCPKEARLPAEQQKPGSSPIGTPMMIGPRCWPVVSWSTRGCRSALAA